MPSTLSRNDTTLAFYRDHAQRFIDSTANLDLHELYHPFLSRLQPGAHILDAGCGSGRDGVAFVERGYKVTAIDAAPAMVAAARSRGLRAELLPFQQMKYRQAFDGIWACASLLHVPHRQIPGVLKRFATALRPGGLLYVSLKEGHGEKTTPDGRFFSYFQPDEFEDALVATGHFEMIDTWLTYAPDSSGKDWPWLNFLATCLG